MVTAVVPQPFCSQAPCHPTSMQLRLEVQGSLEVARGSPERGHTELELEEEEDADPAATRTAVVAERNRTPAGPSAAAVSGDVRIEAQTQTPRSRRRRRRSLRRRSGDAADEGGAATPNQGLSLDSGYIDDTLFMPVRILRRSAGALADQGRRFYQSVAGQPDAMMCRDTDDNLWRYRKSKGLFFRLEACQGLLASL